MTVLPQINKDERLAMAKTLAQGLAYLHANDMIHGDIHPKNIGMNHFT